MFRHPLLIVSLLLLAANVAPAHRQTKTPAKATVTINPDVAKQTFDGMGCGSIFYGGHLTSLGKRKKYKLQNQLYDDIFKEVPTEFLHVMIRPDFEPTNDNDDPYELEFVKDDFKKNRDALKVCREAKKRRPDMKIYATLYSPPAWMKTNGEETGGGSRPLTPGMKIVESEVKGPTTRLVVATGGKKKRMESIVKTSAFVDADTNHLVIHVVNISNEPAEFELKVKSPRYREATFSTTRTSTKASEELGEPVTLKAGKYSGSLGPREMLTLETGKRSSKTQPFWR